MGELIITTSGLMLSVGSIPGAVGIALVVLSLGAGVAAGLHAITKYTDIDI